MSEAPRDWEARYRKGDMPWDSGLPSQELQRVLAELADEFVLPRATALEAGCGTGTNAVFLAEAGFDVTAVDLAPTAIATAQQRAADAGVEVNFIAADITKWTHSGPPFDFVFDRGCYHCVLKVDVESYLQMLSRVTQAGSFLLTITGNTNASEVGGPPQLSAQELLTDFDNLFVLKCLREIHLEDAGHVRGPLAWSALWQRR